MLGEKVKQQPLLSALNFKLVIA